MEDCIFCKIARKQIPADIIYETDSVVIFKDIQPVAPVHVLVVPKTHITNIKDINQDNYHLLPEIVEAINKAAELTGISESGYRVINNCGENAGQTVKHIHFHVIGGTNLGPKLI